MSDNRPRQSFRGTRALVVHAADHNRDALLRQLGRLGLTLSVHDKIDEEVLGETVDVVFFDADLAFEAPYRRPAIWPDLPVIALVGTETPGRLEWCCKQDLAAHIIKPMRTSGVYAALVFAFYHHGRRANLMSKVAHLEGRVRGRRVIMHAVNDIMMERGLDEPGAFGLVRRFAMENRLTLEAASAELMARRKRQIG